jgi:hypothetical protein
VTEFESLGYGNLEECGRRILYPDYDAVKGEGDFGSHLIIFFAR